MANAKLKGDFPDDNSATADNLYGSPFKTSGAIYSNTPYTLSSKFCSFAGPYNPKSSEMRDKAVKLFEEYFSNPQ
ncbi:hypothetical protein RIR_jg8195.t1 [Rhizophagus irregularis DAOM 181602=DAOM 197198]|nr:hypothetical protein RIR_jg8195.t1 [Rhizophagus irregularis DAOM 181602=DAOM 197198]